MLLGTLLLLALAAQTPEPSRVDLVAAATFAHDRGDLAQARELYERALLLAPAKATLLYRLAWCCAAAEDLHAASSYLLTAAAAGLREVEDLASNPAFVPLHAHPRWNELVATVERNAREYERTIRLPELRRELLAMAREDQLVREHADALPMAENCPGAGHDAEATASGTSGTGHDGDDATEDSYEQVVVTGDGSAPACALLGFDAVDRANTRRMHEIVAAHGWPTRSLVGEDGEGAAWLLVQHADLEPDFQRACLERMKAAGEGEVGLDHLAYLTDRVAINAHEPQVYGTQFRAEGGRMVPAPMIDPARVDERRRAMGLYSFATYKAHFEADGAR